MKTGRLHTSSFAYGDPRDSGSRHWPRHKITFWQVVVFIITILSLIGLTILVCTSQVSETEIKNAFDVRY